MMTEMQVQATMVLVAREVVVMDSSGDRQDTISRAEAATNLSARLSTAAPHRRSEAQHTHPVVTSVVDRIMAAEPE